MDKVLGLVLSIFLLGLVSNAQADVFLDTAKKAEQAFQNKDYDQAEALWMVLGKQFPMDIRIQNNLAVLEISRGEYDAAKERLERALKNQSRVGVALTNLNQIYAYEAQRAYKKAFGSSDLVKPRAKLIMISEDISLTSVKLEQEAWNHANQKILNSLENWRSAWSDQNVVAYLNAYQKGFRPDSGATHSNWVETRKTNVGSPKFIKVALTEVEVLPLSDTLARVTFLQNYKSDRLQSTVRKVMFFEADKQSLGNWKITQEIVLYVK